MPRARIPGQVLHVLVCSMKLVILFLVAAMVIGLAYIFFLSTGTMSAAPRSCPPAVQSEVVFHFKMDVWVLALIGGIGAGLLYYTFLRRQVFFGSDYLRFGSSAVGGLVLGFLLVGIDIASSSDCLRTAIGPETQIEPAPILSIFGQIFNWVYLAIALDMVLIMILVVQLTRLARRLYLGGA